MNQESVPGMQVTLDTSVLLEYWKDQAKRALVERLLVLAEEKQIDLAITARVREDIPLEPLTSKDNALAEKCHRDSWRWSGWRYLGTPGRVAP